MSPKKESIRDPSTNPPKTMFQLSGFYHKLYGFGVRSRGCEVCVGSRGLGSSKPKWEFPKIGEPLFSTLNSRILIIRTPK